MVSKFNIYKYFRLHEEINDFFEWMVPNKAEHDMRIRVVEKIEKCIQVKNKKFQSVEKY